MPQLITKIIPKLIFLGGVLAVYGSIGTISYALGYSEYFSDWVKNFNNIPSYFLAILGLLNLALGVIWILAYKPLKRQDYLGWQLLAGSLVVWSLQTGLLAFYSQNSFIYGALLMFFALYLLMRLKNIYKKNSKDQPK